jgi:CheY-like chemotaxis protein
MNTTINPLVRPENAEPAYDSWREAASLAGQTPPALNPPNAVPTPPVPPRSLHVLFIDDDEQLLEVMKDCLTEFKHRVQGASGGVCGLERFRIALLKSDPFDVVITDMKMPDMNGCAVARAIKAECPDVPVILLTGMGADLKEVNLASVPVDAVVNKPTRMKELNDLLLRLARRA